MSTELVTPADIDKLVEFNRTLMEKKGTHFGLNRAELDKIFQGLDKFESIGDKKRRTTSKAAWIAYSIASQRIFFNGNKRSSTIATVRFLNANGFDLLIELLDVKAGWHDVLTGVQKNRYGFDDVKDFLKRRVVPQPTCFPEPWDTYDRAPDLMKAFDLEDASLIGQEGEGTITVELLEKIRASHADLSEALARDDPSLIKDN